MKQILLLLVASLLILTSCDNNVAVNKAFAKYSHRDGITTITVPGWLIGLGARLGDLSDEERELLDCIDKVKVLAVEDENLNAVINLHEEFHNLINRNNEYEELLTVRDKDEDVTIFGKMDEDLINELVILVGGDDNAMVYLKGEIKPENINNIIDVSNPDKIMTMNF